MMTDAELDALYDRYPEAETFAFGEDPEDGARLVALVRAGRKTASWGALRDYLDSDDPMPVVGGQAIVVDWDGNPELVIETTAVTIRRFKDVPEEFALAEGEHASRADWADQHARALEASGGFTPEMELVCETFRVIEDLGRA